MKVKIETAGMFGEGDARKRYEAGSVVEVPVETFEMNSGWMKAVEPDTALSEASAPKAAAPSNKTE